MYAYIYDERVCASKKELLDKIEARLAQLDIKGPITRLHPLTNVEEATSRLLERGATTLVVIGDDLSLLRLIRIGVPERLAIGFVSIGRHDNLSKKLFFSNLETNLEALASRRIVRITLARIDREFFIDRVTIELASHFTAIADDAYSVKTAWQESSVIVTNRAFSKLSLESKKISGLCMKLSQKKFFALRYSSSSQNEKSVFPLKSVIITSQTPMLLTVDGEAKKPEVHIRVSLSTRMVALISGKQQTHTHGF